MGRYCNVFNEPVERARLTRATLSWKSTLTRFSLPLPTLVSPLVSSK